MEQADPPSCPLDGECSECGLEFLWSDLLNQRIAPVWSYEHGDRWSLLLWLRTHGCACDPSRFWQSLRLEQPVRVARLLASIVTILLAVHLLIAGTMAYRVYQSRRGGHGNEFAVETRDQSLHSSAQSALSVNG
jgi:hypothetical protein